MGTTKKHTPISWIEKSNFGVNIGILVVSIGILIVSLSSLIVALLGIVFPIQDIMRSIEQMQRSPEFQELTITYPPDNSIVNSTELVEGKTTFLQSNHYIIVTDLSNAEVNVMVPEVRVLPDGSWRGFARFISDKSERFAVRAIATKSVIAPGPLTKIPDYTVFSKQIIVTLHK